MADAWRLAGNTWPLKIVWSREDDIKGGYYRPMHVHRAEIGFDDKGQVLGWQHAIVGQSILMGTPFEPLMVKIGVDSVMVEGGSVVAYVVEASMREGQPVLHRVSAGVACGTAVNPLSVEAQVQGAALMALGTTLPGPAITLKDGVVQQSNFGDYTVARMLQMPAIAVHIVPSTEPPSGMGEPGLPPLAPAFANAIARITGKPQRSLPFEFA